MDYKQFTDAILQGANLSAPASSIAELGNSMRGAFRASAVARPGQAQGVAAATQAEEEERRRKEAAEAAARKLQDKLDPSKYQKIRKEDGGFAFFDPDGNEIDIDNYAKKTGYRKVDILSDSENPVDLQFIDDYQQMQKLNQAVWSGSDEIEDFKMDYPELFSGGNGSPTPQDLNKKLLEKYPHIFGMGNYETSRKNLGSPLFRINSGGSMLGGGGAPAPAGGTQRWKR